MRKALLSGLFLAAFVVACGESTNPTGPSTVIVETPNPPTTTVPPTTTSTTTTTTIPLATTRTYVAFGQVPATSPSQLTIVLQPAGAPLSWTVLGTYRTAGGGTGRVTGTFAGTLDAGTFDGTLTSETPECVAERSFSGTVDTQFLRWTGGTTLTDCKGSPLAFNTLMMLPTSAPPPVSTVNSTSTIPLQCSYALSTSSTSVPTTGGQATVGVTTPPTCGWTVQNFVDWISVVPQTGNGSATIALTVAPGPPRSATLVIAGVPFVVNQN